LADKTMSGAHSALWSCVLPVRFEFEVRFVLVTGRDRVLVTGRDRSVYACSVIDGARWLSAT
jgi:hypothetical protein